MRADARQNRERLLEAAVELILERGGEPTRDAVAAHAEVGIGTLYRHFPDQQALLHTAARHVLERSIAAGEAIIESDVEGLDAVRQYLHAALDHGIGVVNMIHPLLDDTDWPDLTARADALMTELVERCRLDPRLRDEVQVTDIVFASIRFGRPLAIGLLSTDDREIAHRQLDRYVDGFLTGGFRVEGDRR